MSRSIERLLVANRSEIACRIFRSAREAGIETVAVYSDPDAGSAHVALADRAVGLGGDTPGESYLAVEKVIAAAKESGADAIHPGYGFLAENTAFAARVAEEGIVFVGPTPETISLMGDKIMAREKAEEHRIPMVPSAEIDADTAIDSLAASAQEMGYPVVVKAAAGGGGRGMRVVNEADALPDAIAQARREAESAFGDGRVYLEKYLTEPRHIEVQVFGLADGRVLTLGERECSVQRRHQKVVEEAPSPFLSEDRRAEMLASARTLAKAVEYRGAGTVEYIVDRDGSFYFLEMNTRLQVEHAVTEMVTGVDLVSWQLDTAMGRVPDAAAAAPDDLPLRGHAVECRLYAEDPAAGFMPSAGSVDRLELPTGPGVRVDHGLIEGFEVPVLYDSMLAKLVTFGENREAAIERMLGALQELSLLGIGHNGVFLADVVDSPAFRDGAFTTTMLEREWTEWQPSDPPEIEVALAAAALVLEQAAPSRAGGGRERIDGPWERLGAWRAGGNR